MKELKLTTAERTAFMRIRNALVHGLKPPTTRDLTEFLGYKSPRSGAVIVNRLIELGFLYRDSTGSLLLRRDISEGEATTNTVNIPVVGSAPCGGPLLAEENVETTIPISTKLVPPPFEYFILRAKGDSMDRKGIKDGHLVLVRKQCTAMNGEIVVASVNDEATIKEFHQTDRDTVVLMPRSSNPQHQPIVLTADLQIRGIVLRSLPSDPASQPAGEGHS
jgi:repressor LexA